MNNRNTKPRTRSGFTVLTSLVILLLVLSGCSTADSTSGTAQTEPVMFTLEELAQYDGQDGNPAYIAVDGIVYDVSDIPQWAGGEHAGGRFQAGRDYSEEIRSESPHGFTMLSRAEEVGILVD